MSHPLTVELTVQELDTAWNAMEYSYDTFINDMEGREESEEQELERLRVLKLRFEQLIENAQQSSQEASERR